MKNIERRAVVVRVLALLLFSGLCLFSALFLIKGGNWVSAAFNRHLYNSAGELISGTVLDRSGTVLSSASDGKRTYSKDKTVRKATLHVVGDLQGNIGTGALNAFADKLTGFNIINGAFGTEKGSDLTLTIDADYNKIAYQALNGRSGTVAVYNYKTGKILCLVSAPSYDPENVPSDLETSGSYQGAYINRFLSATFPPGSVFKTVTLAAAIEKIPDLFDRTWTCEGSVTLGDDTITCPEVHGKEDIKSAFANSCNVVFAQLAEELGPKTMEKYTKKAGLTDSYSVSSLPAAAGTFDFSGAAEGELGWAGVGQYHDLVNPCSLMVYMGAVANGGRAAVPYLIRQTTDALGLTTKPLFTKKTRTLISAKTASTLADLMANNVEETYGTSRFPNMDLCAKSGTAEVGGGKSPDAWFTGFLRDEDHPYAFVVLVENGGGGASVAGTVAGKVLRAMVS